MIAYEELYIDGLKVDIDKVAIERDYTTPFFSDISKIFIDSTKTITLPQTEVNMSVMEYLQQPDMNTAFPYELHLANYYVNGIHLIKDGEVKVLDDFEIQITYGINRGKYNYLNSKKLNEVTVNGTNITEDDWVVRWDKNNMFASGKKYKYLNYVSVERTSEIKIINQVLQPKTDVPYPFAGNEKEMTQHPFIPYNNILDLIITDFNNNNTAQLSTTLFDGLKNRLTNQGLILGGNKDTRIEEFTYNYTNTTFLNQSLFISRNNLPPYEDKGLMSIIDISFLIGFPDSIVGVKFPKVITVEMDFEISNNIGGLKLVKLTNPVTFIRNIEPISNTNGFFHYKTIVDVEIDEYRVFEFRFLNGIVNATYKSGGSIKFSCKSENAIYSLKPTDYKGRYSCLNNLPELTYMDFLKSMLIMTGGFFKYDENGLKLMFLDEFKTNLDNGNVLDWSDKVKKSTKSAYQFNSNAQKNYIKYANSKDIAYKNYDSIDVSDETLALERDMLTIPFNLADRNTNTLSEFVLYKQKVSTTEDDGQTATSFENEYSEKKSVSVYDLNGLAINELVLPNGTYDNGKYTEYFNAAPSTIASPYNFNFSYDQNIYYDSCLASSIDFPAFRPSELIKVGDRLKSVNGVLVPIDIFVTGFDVNGDIIIFSYPIANDPEIMVEGNTFIIEENQLTNKFTFDEFEPDIATPLVGYILTELNGVANNSGIYISYIDNSNPNNPVYYLSDTILFCGQFYKMVFQRNFIGFIDRNYLTYKKLVNRPIVKEVDVFLDFYETSSIDYSKPIYIKDWGKYSMLLELSVPNKGLSKAKLLLINTNL